MVVLGNLPYVDTHKAELLFGASDSPRQGTVEIAHP